MASKYPPGETPPPPLTKGPGYGNLNDRFGYIYSMLVLALDSTLKIIPGTESSPGRISTSGAVGKNNAPPCPLEVYDASTEEDGPLIGVRWGTIVGRQPTDFSAGGDPPFTISATADCYVYAYAYADLEFVRWTDAGVVTNTDAFLANTTEIAYKMIGSVKFEDGKISEVTSACGNVTMDFCELADS